MASLTRSPNGGYKVRWREDGRNRGRTFKAQGDAYAFLGEMQNRIDAVEHQRANRRIADTIALQHTSAFSDAIDVRGHYVYCLWGTNKYKPLYVGRSSNILARLGAHLAEPAKREVVRRVTLTGCDSYDDMCRLELALIRRYQPRLNTAGVA